MRTISRWVVPLASVVLVASCGGGAKKATESAAATGEVSPPVAQTGEQIYTRCATCHQPTGQGIPGTYPALAGSEFSTAKNPAVPIRVVLHGLQGPITVKGATYNGIMPAYGTGIEMSDEEVAAVLTYVRSAWGNNAGAVTPQDVAKERAAGTPPGPVTAEALRPLL